MRTVLAVALLTSALLGACGGSSDGDGTLDLGRLTGTWTGSASTELGPAGDCPAGTGCAELGTTTVSGSRLGVVLHGLGAIGLSGPCEDDLIPVSPTSDSTFTVAPYTCRPVTSSLCDPPTLWNIAGGAGTVAGGALMVGMTGTFTSCGRTAGFVYRFTGTR